MVFLKDKILIKSLREMNCYGSTRFLRKFSTKNWTRRGLDNLLVIIDRTGSIDRAEGSGHRARDTVAFLERETPDFIPSTLATQFAGPQTSRLQHLECAAGEGLPLQDN